MGIDRTFGLAFAKSQIAAGDRLPAGGTVFMSLADRDKPAAVTAARRFAELDFRIAATAGTARFLEDHGVAVDIIVTKLNEAGERDAEVDEFDGPDAVQLIAGGEITLVVNSPRGPGARADGTYIRAAANFHRVPLLTTAAAGLAAAEGMADWARHELRVRSLQEWHRGGSDQLELPL
jgi:carbamoyl-phosphate synthase large subunit